MQRIFYISLFITIIHTGCEPEEGQGPFRPEIAVYSVLKANTFAEARIEYTQDLFDTTTYLFHTYVNANREHHTYINPKLICPSAKVALFEKDVLVDSLRYNSTTCLYEGSSHKVEPRGQYRLEISVNDLPLIYAVTTVPYPVEILGLDTFTTAYDGYIRFWNKEYPIMHITLIFTDRPGENNFYELTGGKWISDDSLISWNTTDQYYEFDFNPNSIFENIPWNGGFSPAYFSDKLFNGETISLKLEEWQFGQGFFIFPWDSLLCFNLVSVSAEEAKYHRSEDRYWYNYNVNNAFSEPVSMYSNIVNGAGIFAAVAESSDTIKLYK